MTFRSFLMASVVGLVALVVGVRSADAADPNCDPPNVLILFDVSGSMGGAGNPLSKYNQAVDAIEAVVHGVDSVSQVNLEDKIRFGLFTFPDYLPGTSTSGFCGVSIDHVIEPEITNAAAIMSYIDPAGLAFFGGPTSKMDTPMFQAIQAVGDLESLNDPNRRSYILLITDGVQDCCRGGDYDLEADCEIAGQESSSTYNPFDWTEWLENRQDLVDLVGLLKTNKKIQTFVVGFSTGIDAETLNRMAVSAGTSIVTNCDTASDTCYYSAIDTTSLESVIEDVMVIVQTEVCDTTDNDCDGDIDEDWPTLGQTCSAGFGACQVTGELICAMDGETVECSEKPGNATTEVCDSIDNDCNGKTDDGFTFFDAKIGEPCDGEDGDQCEDGIVVCDEVNNAAVCNEVGPGRSETCNNKDDDCDGQTDEGTDQPCSSECGTGLRRCEGGVLLPCDAPTASGPEICADGIDNNCNGQTDEYYEEECSTACGTGTRKCENGQFTTCTAPAPTAEVCDLQDNDCNGIIDDGNLCALGSVCFCGTCQVACSAEGLCSDGLWCVEGYCVVDECPDGQHCVSQQCVPGDKVSFQPDGTKPMGGCMAGAAGGLGSVWLMAFGLFGLAVRRRRF